jgi:hypothetical protein
VYRAKVYIPAPLGDVVGVADSVSGLRLLAADFTLLSHDCFLILSRCQTETFILADSAFSHNSATLR